MELVQEFKLLDIHPIRQFRWENGLQALLVSNPVSPVAAYLTLYSVGSASEQARQRGLAHFFEHMMFRETERLGDGDFDRAISEIGGVGLNAYTSYDATAYHVNVPVAHLERVIELEADRMVNLRLSPDLIEKERGAVLGEMKMYKDMPSEQVWESLMAAAYPAHPYRHPIIGYMEQVADFKDEDFADFYRSHYAPNRALVVIAGGFDEAATLARLEQAYGGLAAGAAQPARAEDEAPAEGVRLEIFHGKVSTETLVIATRSPGLTHPRMPALLLLSALLGAGQSSPLHREIVLEGLGTHVSASVLDTELMLASPGLFVFEVGLQHGVAAERAEAAIEKVLKGFLDDGIPPEEMERARNQTRLGYFASLRSNMSLARQVGGYALACGDPIFSEKLLHAAVNTPEEEVLAALRDHVTDPPRVVLMQRAGAEKAAS